MIPKIIWTYWDNPTIPNYIKDCLDSWRYHCKNNWSINVLNKETIKLFLEENIDYPSNIWNDDPVKHSDMFGVALINKYGGIWMDANIIMRKSIDFITDKEWFGYYCPPDYGNESPEAFLFASYKNSYTINKIHKLFFEIFSIKKSERNQVLEEKYNIKDSYLYPQYLMLYLMKTDEKINNTIKINSLNQWTTIYILINILVTKNIKYKYEIYEYLLESKDKIPDVMMDEPLLKLQGASLFQDYCLLDENSMWYKLTKCLHNS